MRTPYLVVSLTLLAPTAFADPAPSVPRAQSPSARPAAAPRPGIAPPAPPQPAAVQLSPIDLATVPAPCRPLAKQAGAPTAAIALAGRVSLASCMVEHAVAPISLCDCGESIAAVDKAAAPAIALIDEVISAAEHLDPAGQLIATHAKGEIYAGFTVRLLATLPKPGAEAGEAELTLRDLRHQALDAQLAPWRATATTAFQRVVALAQAHPELAGKPAVAAALRDSQQRLAAEIATAQPAAPNS